MQYCGRSSLLLKAYRSVLIAVTATAVVAGGVDAQGKSARKLNPVDVTTHLQDEQSIALLKNANVRHTRTGLYWNLWRDDPSYREEFAAGIKRLSDANIEVTVVVHSVIIGTYETREQVYQDFAAFMGARAKQFPTVSSWQLWNEQNAPGWTPIFGSGVVSMREQGRNYAQMLNLVSGDQGGQSRSQGRCGWTGKYVF